MEPRTGSQKAKVPSWTGHPFLGFTFLISRSRIRQKFSTDLSSEFLYPIPKPRDSRAHLRKVCLVGVWVGGSCSLSMSLVTVGSAQSFPALPPGE